MMIPSVVVASLSIRSRNVACAGNKGRSKTTLPCNAYERIITRNNLGRRISEQSATVPLIRNPSLCILIPTGWDVGDDHVELREGNNEGH